MQLSELTSFYKQKLESAQSKRESRIYTKIYALSLDLETKAFSNEQLAALEQKLDELNMTGYAEDFRKAATKCYQQLIVYLRKELDLHMDGYFTGIYMVLGMSIGMALGAAFSTIWGSNGGMIIGMCIGLAIGRRKDIKVKKEGKSLSYGLAKNHAA